MKVETDSDRLSMSKMPVTSKTNFVDLLTVGSGTKSQDDDTVPVAPKDAAGE